MNSEERKQVINKFAESVGGTAAGRAGMSEAAYCAARIRKIVADRGGRMTEAQRHMLESCDRISGIRQVEA